MRIDFEIHRGSSALDQGSPTNSLWTGTCLEHCRNRARQTSEALTAGCRQHVKPRPLRSAEKTLLGNHPWCPKGWGTLFQIKNFMYSNCRIEVYLSWTATYKQHLYSLFKIFIVVIILSLLIFISCRYVSVILVMQHTNIIKQPIVTWYNL